MDVLIELERALHSPEIRKNPTKRRQLLHSEFSEVGALGASYYVQTISHMMDSEHSWKHQVLSQDFEIKVLAQDVCLVLYKSCLLSPDNPPSQFAKRSSVWVKTTGNWQIQYHQGTPCDPFSLDIKQKQ